MTLHKAIIRITLFIAISLVGSSGWCYTLASPIELSQLISLFMTNPNEYPSWSMGVGETGRQIKWTSIGVEEHKHCGSYASCRKGVARVSIGKKEMQNLRERLDPVEWNIFIASSSLSKFGPELVEIAPLCDTVQCSFELKQTLVSNGFTLQQLCHAGPAPFKTTVFLAKQQGKHIYIAYNENLGSGGASNSITLYLKKPVSDDFLCAEAKSME